ncbi:hypothetical protein TrVFT333_010990 [Trichoderma virens FT-333]|nr:hypothetical protein TrVFT333_010990 [Trichoderma virens FT-333]
MEHNRPNSRQHLSIPQAATSSAPSPQLRHRPSFRDRFWARTSANYDGEDDVVQEPQANPTKKSPYVPMNAASGFSRTASTPREQFKRRSRSDERPSSRELGINVHARSPLSDLAAGHLYVHTESEPDTTDFADFIAAAQTEERVRRAASQRQGARSHYRDSGYYSASNGGRNDHGPYSPSLPSSASAAGAARLKAQPSRTFGQRIAEYIKPPRDDSVPSVSR